MIWKRKVYKTKWVVEKEQKELYSSRMLGPQGFWVLTDRVLIWILTDRVLFRVLNDRVFLRILSDRVLFRVLYDRILLRALKLGSFLGSVDFGFFQGSSALLCKYAKWKYYLFIKVFRWICKKTFCSINYSIQVKVLMIFEYLLH